MKNFRPVSLQHSFVIRACETSIVETIQIESVSHGSTDTAKLIPTFQHYMVTADERC